MNKEIRYSLTDNILDSDNNYLYICSNNFFLHRDRNSFVRWVSDVKPFTDVLDKNNLEYDIIGNKTEQLTRIDIKISDLKIKIREDKINKILND